MSPLGLVLQVVAVAVTVLAAFRARFIITRPAHMRVLIMALMVFYVLRFFVPLLFLPVPRRVLIHI
jgi:hypothetical protein